jgi:DNA-directed RNA polymerase specialized sigma24 family protein
MLSSTHDVIRCLMTYTDWWQMSTSSVLQVGVARRGQEGGDGLHPGLVDTLDERTELCRRVGLLNERDRRVLIMWYVLQLPVADIARAIGVSGRQCHRLRGRAVRRIVDLGEEAEAVA